MATPGSSRGGACAVHRRPLLLSVLLAACCTAVFLSFYPGMSNPDMAREYVGIRRGIYGDWNPPLMMFLWSLLDPVLPGKAGLFALFAATHFLAAALLFRYVLARCGAAAWLGVLGMALIMVSPAFLGQGAMLFKDFLMMTLLVIGAAAALLSLEAESRPARLGWLALSLGGILAGSLIRSNAVFAASCLLLGLFGQRATRRMAAFIAAAVIGAALLIPFNAALNGALFDPKRLSVENSLFIFDFAGITHFSGQSVFPPELHIHYGLAENEVCYTPRWWDTFIDWRDLHAARFGVGETLEVAYVADSRFTACQSVWRSMREAYLTSGRSFAADWLGVIAAHPLAYLQHRLSHFNQTLDFLVPHSVTIVRSREQPNAFGWTYTPGPLASAVITLANVGNSLPIFWSPVWLVMGLVGFFTAARMEASPLRHAVLVLTGSGLFYSGGFFLVGVASDYRYHLWLFLTATIAMVLLACQALASGTLRPLVLRYALWSLPVIVPIVIWRAFDLPAPGGV